MSKTKIDKIYKTPDKLLKAGLFLKYQVRQFGWKVEDMIEGSGSHLSPVSEGSNIENLDSLKKSWEENGYLLLKADPSSNIIEIINEEILRIRNYLESKGQGKRDEFGRTNRIINTHSMSRVILNFLCNDRLQLFLRYAFNDEPVLVGSNTFQTGTEQDIHVDPQYVYTEPNETFVGAWTALEDIHEDSGPVFYYEKSHLNPIHVKQVLNKYPDLKQKILKIRQGKAIVGRSRKHWDLATEIDKVYKKELASYWKNSGRKKIPVLIGKGDTVLWKQWLVHGGLPRNNPKMTRRSIAYHFCARNCNLWPISDFYLNSDRLSDIRPQKKRIKKCSRGLYLRQYLTQILDF